MLDITISLEHITDFSEVYMGYGKLIYEIKATTASAAYKGISHFPLFLISMIV